MNTMVLQAITHHENGALVAGQAKLHAYAAGRIEAQATFQTRRAVAQAQTDQANKALQRWLQETYADSYNVRDYDQAIMIPAPWSRTHCHAFGLSEPMGRLLRCIVEDTLTALPERRRLIMYSPESTRWHVNLDRFPTWESAAAWLSGPGMVTAVTWLSAQSKYPNGRRPRGQGAGVGHGARAGF